MTKMEESCEDEVGTVIKLTASELGSLDNDVDLSVRIMDQLMKWFTRIECKRKGVFVYTSSNCAFLDDSPPDPAKLDVLRDRVLRYNAVFAPCHGPWGKSKGMRWYLYAFTRTRVYRLDNNACTLTQAQAHLGPVLRKLRTTVPAYTVQVVKRVAEAAARVDSGVLLYDNAERLMRHRFWSKPNRDLDQAREKDSIIHDIDGDDAKRLRKEIKQHLERFIDRTPKARKPAIVVSKMKKPPPPPVRSKKRRPKIPAWATRAAISIALGGGGTTWMHAPMRWN